MERNSGIIKRSLILIGAGGVLLIEITVKAIDYRIISAFASTSSHQVETSLFVDLIALANHFTAKLSSIVLQLLYNSLAESLDPLSFVIDSVVRLLGILGQVGFAEQLRDKLVSSVSLQNLIERVA